MRLTPEQVAEEKKYLSEFKEMLWFGEHDEIVYCPKCKYSDFSKTIEYAYTCKNRLSPCRNRIAAANFGCTYGERKESDNDA